jgi:hypothetical protein
MVDILNNARDCCSNCRFSKMIAAPNNALITVCRRYPPISVGSVVQGPKGAVVLSDSRSPMIGDPKGDWCGEWAPEAKLN